MKIDCCSAYKYYPFRQLVDDHTRRHYLSRGEIDGSTVALSSAKRKGQNSEFETEEIAHAHPAEMHPVCIVNKLAPPIL